MNPSARKRGREMDGLLAHDAPDICKDSGGVRRRQPAVGARCEANRSSATGPKRLWGNPRCGAGEGASPACRPTEPRFAEGTRRQPAKLSAASKQSFRAERREPTRRCERCTQTHDPSREGQPEWSFGIRNGERSVAKGTKDKASREVSGLGREQTSEGENPKDAAGMEQARQVAGGEARRGRENPGRADRASSHARNGDDGVTPKGAAQRNRDRRGRTEPGHAAARSTLGCKSVGRLCGVGTVQSRKPRR